MYAPEYYGGGGGTGDATLANQQAILAQLDAIAANVEAIQQADENTPDVL